jgi:hypothetical protein
VTPAHPHRQLLGAALFPPGGANESAAGDALDDGVDWAAPPPDAYVGVQPFPAYVYAAQLRDRLAAHSRGVAVPRVGLGSFSPVWDAAGVNARVAPYLQPPPKATAAAYAGGWAAAHATAGLSVPCAAPINVSTVDWAPADLGVTPATLLLSWVPLLVGGRRAEDAVGKDGRHAASGEGVHGRRAANGGVGAEAPLRVTADDPARCLRPDPCNAGWLLPVVPATPITAAVYEAETRNGLLMLLDTPVLPPPVLLALWKAGITPFRGSPAPDVAAPPTEGCPYTAVADGDVGQLLLALQLAAARAGDLGVGAAV